MYTSSLFTYPVLDRRTIETILQKINKMTGRHGIVKFFAASNDKGKIAGWVSELNGILQVFNVCSAGPGVVLANYPVLRLS